MDPTASFFMELLRSFGLPVALLIALAYYHIKELRRKDDTWTAERKQWNEELKNWQTKLDNAHAETARVYEARIAANEDLIRESAEAMRMGADASRELVKAFDVSSRRK